MAQNLDNAVSLFDAIIEDHLEMIAEKNLLSWVHSDLWTMESKRFAITFPWKLRI